MIISRKPRRYLPPIEAPDGRPVAFLLAPLSSAVAAGLDAKIQASVSIADALKMHGAMFADAKNATPEEKETALVAALAGTSLTARDLARVFGRLDPADVDDVCRAALKGWENLYDDDGVLIPYSAEQLPQVIAALPLEIKQLLAAAVRQLTDSGTLPGEADENLLDELRDLAEFLGSKYDKSSWKCESCLAAGEHRSRGCGRAVAEPVLILPENGRRLYRCPLSASPRTKMLYAELAAVQQGLAAAPADPTPAWLAACAIFTAAQNLEQKKN